VLSPERFALTARLAVQMDPPVRKGSQNGGFCEKLVGGPRVERFVVDAGRRRINGGFGSRHGSAKGAGKKKNKGSAKQGYGVKLRRKTLPTRESSENRGTRRYREKCKCKNLNSPRQYINA